MAKGYVQLNRTHETFELLKDHNAFVLLTIIALRARRTQDFSIHELEPGEAMIGDYRNYNMSEMSYRTAKHRLKKYGFITIRTTNKGTIAKLLNPSVFNINSNEVTNETTDGLTGQQQASNRPVTTNNKDKNDNKEIINKYPPKELDELFEEAWKSYVPHERKKGHKGRAKQKYSDLLNKHNVDPQEILDGIKRYCHYCREKDEYTKDMTVFFNQATWEEDCIVESDSSGRDEIRRMMEDK